MVRLPRHSAALICQAKHACGCCVYCVQSCHMRFSEVREHFSLSAIRCCLDSWILCYLDGFCACLQALALVAEDEAEGLEEPEIVAELGLNGQILRRILQAGAHLSDGIPLLTQSGKQTTSLRRIG